MNGRHEVKFDISYSDYYSLLPGLRAVLKADPYVKNNGNYLVRSLYFDTPEAKALQEKLDGVKDRDKYRIRYYNDDLSNIKLERKSKRRDICYKTSVKITEEEVKMLLLGQYDWLQGKKEELFQEFYLKIKTEGLKPQTIVEYERTPFVYSAGNVRITLDHHIRTGLYNLDFLNPDSMSIPVMDSPVILEVKWDAYLPEIVKSVIALEGRRAGAFSKYAACRFVN